jgi:hypothetical protein
VLVQPPQLREAPIAEIALVRITIPSLIRCLVVGGASPADQVLRDKPLGILSSNEPIQLVTVDLRSPGTRSSLDMMGDAGSCSKVALAERACHIRTPVDSRVQMLIYVSCHGEATHWFV